MKSNSYGFFVLFLFLSFFSSDLNAMLDEFKKMTARVEEGARELRQEVKRVVMPKPGGPSLPADNLEPSLTSQAAADTAPRSPSSAKQKSKPNKGKGVVAEGTRAVLEGIEGFLQEREDRSFASAIDRATDKAKDLVTHTATIFEPATGRLIECAADKLNQSATHAEQSTQRLLTHAASELNQSTTHAEQSAQRLIAFTSGELKASTTHTSSELNRSATHAKDEAKELATHTSNELQKTMFVGLGSLYTFTFGSLATYQAGEGNNKKALIFGTAALLGAGCTYKFYKKSLATNKNFKKPPSFFDQLYKDLKPPKTVTISI